ncbi:STAS-like domain-containing protein [Algoriphagus formosus]|uniref:STAS-like domain-containing protein n=1 Tax=Algoriphagus formosus TaxID=2007308 RepID=UPI003F70BCD1
MIQLTEILGKSIAILHSDGLKIYDAIMEELVTNGTVELNFEGISTCTTAFLNASLGKVLINSPKSTALIQILNADNSTLEKIEWVKENALDQARREAREESLREYLENA